MNIQEIVGAIFEYAQGMWRYRWLAIAVAWVVSLGGWLVVATIPDEYRASTRVFVDTDTLLRPLMEGLTASRNTPNELQLVSRAVLTRPNLEQVAQETDLALRARDDAEMEELITELQSRISVVGGRDNLFTIQYDDVSREKATEVVAAVLDTFIESALGNEGTDSEMTERAIAGEIQVHEQRLREADAALAKFKQDNLGYMPDQFGDYYARLQAAVAAATATGDRVRGLTERRDELRRQIEGEEPVLGLVPMAAGSSLGCSQAGQIHAMETELGTLLVQFTDKHPRAVTLQETIAYLRQQCAAERPAGAAVAVPLNPEQALDANPVYQSLRIQLSSAEVELAELRARLATEENEVSVLRRNVDKITEVEAQFKQLNRDYDVVFGRHQQLLSRWEDLQAKQRLDPVTDNVQFRRIEPPFAAAAPVGPNRLVLLAGVLAVALGAGFAIALGLNQLHPVFFARRSLKKLAEFPVLGSISMILTPKQRARRRLEAVAWSGACVLLIMGTGLAILFSAEAAALFRGITGAGA